MLGALAQTLREAANDIARTQEANNAQISNLVPFMQERIQNMAEVTHLAGDQITRSLQTFVKAEQAVRNNAAQSQTVVQQLANATNQMGERMFAALNLMQASGKLLNDTTETVKACQRRGRKSGSRRKPPATDYRSRRETAGQHHQCRRKHGGFGSPHGNKRGEDGTRRRQHFANATRG